MSQLHTAPDDGATSHEEAPLLSHRSNSLPAFRGASAEIGLLVRQSPPLIITYLLQFVPYVLATVIAGHLGADDLAAASIGATTIAITGSAFVEGMATALDTLCAQTYGSGDLHGVGLHVQRMILLMFFACLPIGLLWAMSPSLLPFVVKQPHLAVKAGSFLQVSLIGLPPQALFEAVKRFLQVQGDFHTAMWIIGICTPLNVFLSWFFAFQLGMGLDGAALGSSLSQVIRALLLPAYIVYFGQWSHRCWGGFSCQAFRNWGRLAKLSFAGSIAILSEYAAFEILTFSTSYLSTYHLAAQSILTTISIVSWHLPFSVSVVTSTRVGHLVGAGLIKQARRASVIHGFVFVAIGLTSATITFTFRHQLPRLFTQDAQVLAICVQTILAVAYLQIAEASLCGANGLLRGLGRQSFSACVVLVINYAMVVPASIWLELGSPHWGLLAFWVGLPTGMVFIVLVEVLYAKMIRWESCVDTAL